MSMPPEVKKNLDGWIWGLGLTMEADRTRAGVLRNVQDPDPLRMSELRKILVQIRDNPNADLRVLFGLGKSVGGQGVTESTKRLRLILLSWIAAMRNIDRARVPAGLQNYYDQNLNDPWLRGVTGDFKTLECHDSKFRKGEGSPEFTLYGGVCAGDEEKLVRILEGQSRGGKRQTLWGRMPGLRSPDAFIWSVDQPDGGCYAVTTPY